MSRVAAAAGVAIAVVGVRHDQEGEYITMDGSTPSGPEEKGPMRIETPFGDIVLSGGDRLPLSLTEADHAVVEAAAAAKPAHRRGPRGRQRDHDGGVAEGRRRDPDGLVPGHGGRQRASLDRVRGRQPLRPRAPHVPPGRVRSSRPSTSSPRWPSTARSTGTLVDASGDEPAFAFGFGLSYARFDYAALEVVDHRVPADGDLEASVAVANTGDRAGAEVVQLYVGFEGPPVERPVKLLRGFRRIALEAGLLPTLYLEETRVVVEAMGLRDVGAVDQSIPLQDLRSPPSSERERLNVRKGRILEVTVVPPTKAF